MRTFLSFAFLFALTSCAWFQQSHNSHKKTQPVLPSAKDENVFCKSKCEGGVTYVFEANSNGKCALKFSYPCYPHGCDKDRFSCRPECSTDRDCSLGATCNTTESRCVPQGIYMCKDSFTKVDAAGNQGSCIPYRCNLGQCMSSCVSDSDCAQGFRCESNQCMIK